MIETPRYSRLPRHDETRELGLYHKRIETRAFVLSVYDYPEKTSMADLIVFALAQYSEPEHFVDEETLQEVFAKCGRFGIVSLEDGAITDQWPYIHLGKFYDSVDWLQRSGLVEIDEVMRLTETGSQMGAEMLGDLETRRTPLPVPE